MNMPDRHCNWNLLYSFLLLQLYFVGNILSFGFWKSTVAFGYFIGFFGIWIISLFLLLFFILRILQKRKLEIPFCVIFSLPFCFGLWLETLEIHVVSNLWWLIPTTLTGVFAFYHFAPSYKALMTVIITVLFGISFMGHSDILAKPVDKQKSFNLEKISLDKKSNIHIIMIDALTHSSFLKAFLDVKSRAAEYLASLDDVIYASHMGFSEHVPTREAWAGLFGLDKEVSYGAFSGRLPSPLTTLLQNNNYTVQTGFSSNYFGPKGQYVDHYHYKSARLLNSLICSLHKSYLGLCSNFSGSIADYFFKNYDKRLWPNKVINLIEEAEQNMPAPIFSAFYIYRPIGHTRYDYQTDSKKMFEEYKEYFVKEDQKAQRILEDIDRLRKKYPKSIFIISGDHGPWLSRTEKENKRFLTLDRHGVALALLNASNLCPQSQSWLKQQQYLTPSRMLAASLACNGRSRELTRHFKDNENFIRFGKSLEQYK